MCSRIKYCNSVEFKSIGLPPAAAMTAVDPVLVHTHMPDDQTFKLCSTSYDIPANRVIVPYSVCVVGLESSSTLCNQPIRKRDTAAGLGFAINISFKAGTRRVSEKVDFTLHRIRARWVKCSWDSP